MADLKQKAAALVTVSDADGTNGAVLTTPYTWPEATLVDSQGDDVDIRKSLDKPLTLVFFGYSRCPDICQAVMADLSAATIAADIHTILTDRIATPEEGT